MTHEELKQTLEGLGLEGMEVTVDGRPGHLVAVVQSPVFTNMEEHARQLIIWEYLLRKLTDEQRIEVEFVFTDAPGDN